MSAARDCGAIERFAAPVPPRQSMSRRAALLLVNGKGRRSARAAARLMMRALGARVDAAPMILFDASERLVMGEIGREVA